MNKKQIPVVVGILSMNLLLMLSTTASVAIAAMVKSFPNEPVSKVQLVGSIPQLGQIIATAMFSYLAFKMARKNLGLLAVAIVAIAGVVPAIYSSSLNLILASMVLVGFGTGTISNIVPVLLKQHFDGEARATAMGWAVGVTNVGMMIFTAVGGVLGSVDWHNLFWIYALALIVFIVAFLFIPKDIKIADQEENSQDKNEPKLKLGELLKSLSGYVYVIYLISFMLSIAMMAFLSNQSIVLGSQGKGTAYVAIVSAIGNVGGIITAAGLKYIRKFTKTNTIAWGFVAFALAFACIMFSSNMIMHVIGNAFSGMGIVLVNATVPFELSVLTNEKQFTLAISINTLLSSIAGMVVPLILAVLRITPGADSFIAGIVVSLGTALLLMLTRFGARIDKSKQAN